MAMPPDACGKTASASQTQQNPEYRGKEGATPRGADFLQTYESLQKNIKLWWAAEVIWEDVIKSQIPITIFSFQLHL